MTKAKPETRETAAERWRGDGALLMPSLEGVRAVVTGGGRGIGRATCLALSAQGAEVAVLDIDENNAVATASEAESLTAFRCDVTSRSDFEAVLDDFAGGSRRLDVLVNNAGIVDVEPLPNVTLESWRRVFAVNVEGALLASQTAVRIMRQQAIGPDSACRGKIINISSPSAEIGRPPLPAYGASKSALNHLSKSFAAAFGSEAISTTVIYPGSVRDGMWRDLGERLAAVQGLSIAEVEQGRTFHPSSETGDLVVDVARYIGVGLNGSVLGHGGRDRIK